MTLARVPKGCVVDPEYCDGAGRFDRRGTSSEWRRDVSSVIAPELVWFLITVSGCRTAPLHGRAPGLDVTDGTTIVCDTSVKSIARL